VIVDRDEMLTLSRWIDLNLAQKTIIQCHQSVHAVTGVFGFDVLFDRSGRGDVGFRPSNVAFSCFGNASAIERAR